MAWMKSKSTGKFYFTGEFSSESNVANPRQISAAIGLRPELVSSATVKREVTRAETNRAILVKQIADAVLEGIGAGRRDALPVDAEAIRLNVEAELHDELTDPGEEFFDDDLDGIDVES